jgi:nucleotide-binding universal stress UspA family protein
MNPIRRILAATDLSGPSRHAVDRAVRLADETGAQLAALHVVSQGAVDGLRRILDEDTPEVEARILDEARDALDRLLAELVANRSVSAEARIAVGVIVGEIVAQAEAEAADLLVLGARGEGFLRHLLLGTTAERLLRKTNRPVLLVRQLPHDRYRRVVVAVDFSASSVAALRLARTLAPAAELVLLHAFEVPFENKLQFAGVTDEAIARYRHQARQDALRELEAFAAAAGSAAAGARLSVHHGEASRVILEREQQEDCDLLVVGKRGKGVVEELLLGSVTKHVLAESSGDVLVASAGPAQARAPA